MKQLTILLLLLLSADVYAQPTDFLTVNIAYPLSFDTAQVDEQQLLFHVNHKPKKLIRKNIKIASLTIPNSTYYRIGLSSLIDYDTVFMRALSPVLNPIYEFMFIEIDITPNISDDVANIYFDSLFFKSGYYSLDSIATDRPMRLKRKTYTRYTLIRNTYSDSLMKEHLFSQYLHSASSKIIHKVWYEYYLKKAQEIKQDDEFVNRMLIWLTNHNYKSGSISRRVIFIQKGTIEGDLFFEAGEYSKAKYQYEMVLKIDPVNSYAKKRLGELNKLLE